MKHSLLTALLVFVSILVARAQTRTFIFTINDQIYSTNENKLNDLYGQAFQDMLNRKATTRDKFDLWTISWDWWKDNAYKERISWKTYGSIVGSTTNTMNTGDLTDDDVGIDKNGKSLISLSLPFPTFGCLEREREALAYCRAHAEATTQVLRYSALISYTYNHARLRYVK